MKKKSQGFTLIELMVASVLAIIVLYAMTKILIQNKVIFIVQNNGEKIQNDARFAFEIIGQESRRSGFRGCISGANTAGAWSNFQNLVTPVTYRGNINNIQGSYGSGSSWTPALDSTVTTANPAPAPGFDVLTIRNTGTSPSIVTTAMTTATDSAITVNNTTGLASGGYALISNCSASTLFPVSSASGTKVSSGSAKGVGYVFPAGSQIYSYNTVVFYVATTNGDNILYRQVNGGAPEALVNGVDGFNILYGIDTTGTFNASQYVYANQVTNYQQVVSIRVGLVLRSTQNNISTQTATNNTYIFNGATVTPKDRKLRKIFYTTISLRNMMP